MSQLVLTKNITGQATSATAGKATAGKLQQQHCQRQSNKTVADIVKVQWGGIMGAVGASVPRTSLGLLLGTEAPVMTPSSKTFLFLLAGQYLLNTLKTSSSMYGTMAIGK